MEPARTLTSPRFSAPNISPDPQVRTDTPAARVPQRFWGRFSRALGILLVASASHVWLVRAPGPRIQEAAPAVTLTAPAGTNSSPNTPSVRVVTELVRVGTTGIVPRQPAEPGLIAAPSVTLEARHAPERAPARGPDRVERDSRVSTRAPLSVANRLFTQPLTLTHTLSSPPQLALPARVLSTAATAESRSRPGSQPPAVRTEPDQQMVRQLLQQHVAAFERLDVNAAKAVWPSVDARVVVAQVHVQDVLVWEQELEVLDGLVDVGIVHDAHAGPVRIAVDDRVIQRRVFE